MYEDVYKKGYSTLPNLRKLKEDEVFERDCSDLGPVIAEKAEALGNQKCFMEHDHDPLIYGVCEEWISRNYPRPLSGRNYMEIAREVPEDFLVHRLVGQKDWLSSAHVCFASHWLPEEKIGRSFDEIHQPVPMSLKNSPKLVHAMVHGGIFERFVWSVVYEDKYNFHPRFSHKAFDPSEPRVLVKAERQVTVGFPEHDFCLFVLRQYLIKEERLDKARLASVIEEMTEEQKKYKGLSDCRPLLEYLKK
jgi:hypothetical protein